MSVAERGASPTPGAIKVSARETFLFVQEQVGGDPLDVLEVGAGDGALAFLLAQAGHRVIAVDRAEENVDAAAARGVRAIQCEWPNFSDCCFDAVLFARSLHHLGDLGPALAKAVEVLRAPGWIIVEDFAFADADEDTIRWFADLAGRLAPDFAESGSDSFARRIAAAPDPVDSWFEHTDHLHPFAVMRSALGASGRVTFEGAAPYLYRYFEQVGHRAVDEVLRAERAAIELGEIRPIGRRVVVSVGRPAG